MAYAYAPYTEGYHEGSTSIVLHLIYADVVDILNYSSLDDIDNSQWTSFHGFLLYPD